MIIAKMRDRMNPLYVIVWNMDASEVTYYLSTLHPK